MQPLNSSHNTLEFIFLYGKAGAGKDTQAGLLCGNSPSTLIISTGDIVRAAKDPGHKYHEHIAPHMASVDSGKLLPDEVIVGVVGEEIAEKIGEGKKRFIFTGFPRSIEQLGVLDGMLAKLQEQYGVRQSHILLAVLDTVSEGRAKIRSDQAIAQNQKPRPDDDPEVVRRRLGAYYETIRPMLKELLNNNRLCILRANREIPQVSEVVQSRLRPQERR